MQKLKDIFWCKNCVTMSTRPRITFDERGFCSACQWSEEKKIDWTKRKQMLDNLLNKHRAKGKKIRLYYHSKWGERWVIC